MSKWKIGSLVCTLILSANMAWSQGGAKIASEQLVYNFGTIAESDGMASHVFNPDYRLMRLHTPGMVERADSPGPDGRREDHL